MINKASSKFPTIDFRVGDVCDLPFNNDAFDYILFSFNGIDHIHPERRGIQALREIHRMLKPDGLFLFSSHNSWSVNVICWVVKQRHIMAVRSVEISAAFTILEIKNPLQRVCLIFYKSIQSKKAITTNWI
jgi:SAM-dependent methyltransferase